VERRHDDILNASVNADLIVFYDAAMFARNFEHILPAILL
jgi:hypothetical protein